jgi:Zn finger protein HypA/HybF involved in hydrogenase expression
MKPKGIEKAKTILLQIIGLIQLVQMDKRLGRGLGFGLIAVVLIGLLAMFMVLSRTIGGGNITYSAKGSAGPVVFSHLNHTKGEKAKYICEDCHEHPFRADSNSGFIIQLLSTSDKVVRIGKDTHNVWVAPAGIESGEGKIIEVDRAEKMCSTGTCHDGKESFSRMECLKCHKRR